MHPINRAKGYENLSKKLTKMKDNCDKSVCEAIDHLVQSVIPDEIEYWEAEADSREGDKFAEMFINDK